MARLGPRPGSRGRRSVRFPWRWTILAGVLWATPVHAIPTPDVVAGSVNLIPLLVGSGVACLGGLLQKLKRVAGEGRGTLLGGALLGAAVPGAVLLLIGLSSLESDARTKRIDTLAMYLRCDIGAHHYQSVRPRAAEALERWRPFGNFEYLRIEDVAGRLAAQPDALLIATHSTRIAYESGFPAVRVDGQLRGFEHVRRMELPARLESVTARDLYLYDFSPLGRDLDDFPAHRTIFEPFERVYVVPDIENEDHFVRQSDGTLRPADGWTRVIDWPLRRETWIVDEAHVQFPRMTTTLSSERLAAALRDDEVYVVLPFNGLHRDPEAYLGPAYLSRLLRDLPRSRVLAVDVHSPTTSADLARIATTVDGARFVVAGITKYDYVYQGLDVAFEIWDRLGRDPARFRLEGFSTRLPEAVAINWIDAKRSGPIEMLAGPFWSALAWIQRVTHHSDGASIFIFAALLRLALLPLGIADSRSRILRRQLDEACQGRSPAWIGARKTLEARLGVRTGWELIGGLVTLALILPAYRLLTAPGAPLGVSGVLWVRDLRDPDVWLALIVGSLLLTKLSLGPERRRPLIHLSIATVFTVAMTFVPACVLAYLAGVLTVTTIQDALAGHVARRGFRRALLLRWGPA